MCSLAVAVLVAAAGCDGTDPEPPLDLSGRWSGATDGGLAVTLNLSHDLSTDRLSGTWMVVGGGQSFTGTVNGRLASGSVNLSTGPIFDEYPYAHSARDKTRTLPLRDGLSYSIS